MPLYVPTTQGTPTRLLGPVAITTANTTLATVATGRTWVVTSMAITNTNAGLDAAFSLAIGTTATVTNRFFSAMPIAGNDTIVWDNGGGIAMILASTETLQAISSYAGLNLTVNGYLL